MKITKKSLENFIGNDNDLETSLFDYQFICEKRTNDYPDEYFCIYIQGESFGTGFIQESELDNLILGEEWMDLENIESFLHSVGCTKNEWLELHFVHKLSDLIGYYGTENIFGSDYWPMSEGELRELYDFGD